MVSYFCFYSFSILRFMIPAFYHLLFLPRPLYRHSSHPTTAILSCPSKDQISIRVERQNLRLSFTTNNGKSQVRLWQRLFSLLLFLLPPTKLYSQPWHQIEGLVAKGHSYINTIQKSISHIATWGLSHSSEVNKKLCDYRWYKWSWYSKRKMRVYANGALNMLKPVGFL